MKSTDAVLDSIHQWWVSLADARGDRASIRRCHSPTQVAFVPAYHQLLRKLEGGGERVPWYRQEALAVVAGVLAHVTQDVPGPSFATQLGKPPKGEKKAPLSDLRFRRLLGVQELEQLQGALVRVVRLRDRKANVRSLSRAILYWNDRTRRQWAYDYYAAAPKKEGSA